MVSLGLGTKNGWRAPRCRLSLALLCLTASLEVGLVRGQPGQCQNNTCSDARLCCSDAGFCGTGDPYCGLGCKGGPCVVGSPSSSPSNSSEGACSIGNACANGLCCSKAGYCGSDSSYCGSGCKGGPCSGNSGAEGLRTGSATVGIALASAIATMLFLGSGKGWRAPGWRLIFALLCLMASLQSDLATEDGECANSNGCPEQFKYGACISNTCPHGFCCNSYGFCGTGDQYCGSGCQGGPCSSSSSGKGRSVGATVGIVAVARDRDSEDQSLRGSAEK